MTQESVAGFRWYDVWNVRRAWRNRMGNGYIRKNPYFIGKNADGAEYCVVLSKYGEDFIKSMTREDLHRIAVF